MKILLLGVSALVLLSGPAFAQDDQWPQPSWLNEPVPNDGVRPPVTNNDLPLLREQNVSPIARTQPISQYQDTYQAAPQTYQDVAPASGSRASTDDIIFSGNIGAVTDYRNRGISRSDEGPAIQGAAKLGYRGAYGSLKASTVDLNTDPDANIETAIAVGYQGVFDGLDYDGSLIYTGFPGADNDDTDYWEFVLTGGYDFDVFYGALTWAASPNYMNDSGMSLYYGADIAAPLPIIGGIDLTAKAHLGFLFVDDANNYADDPMDWSLGMFYNVPNYDVDVGVSYVGTNLDDNDCVEDCGSRLMLSVGKSFGQTSRW